MRSLAHLLLLELSLLASVATAQTPDLSGRWSGSFDIVQPDGSVQPDNSVFLLKQNGKTLTGTAGQSEAHQSPIADGEVAGNHALFDVVVNPQMTVHIDLAIDGDHLHGTATGMPIAPGAKGVVDLRRWPEGTAGPARNSRVGYSLRNRRCTRHKTLRRLQPLRYPDTERHGRGQPRVLPRQNRPHRR